MTPDEREGFIEFLRKRLIVTDQNLNDSPLWKLLNSNISATINPENGASDEHVLLVVNAVKAYDRLLSRP